ncbi:MAG: DUF4344 domain-containing metallopeptidase [Candidatus Aminicenantes bacterium]|nr:DUF4344 domain-containing metallopeptidase [Candidatus Aminicenantes bacterium]
MKLKKLLSFLTIASVVFVWGISLSFGQDIEDRGDFNLIIQSPDNPDFQEIADFIEEGGRFRELIDHLNENFALPSDITIIFTEGDGPYFDPENLEIIMNYDFLSMLVSLLIENDYAETDEELEVALLDITEFIFYHEVGHALIHILDIPVVGKEEDAVDSLSALIITIALEEPDILITAADFWWMMSEQNDEFDDADFWDEHSLDIQRFYSIICWVYGSDPDKYADLIREEGFDEDRADRCIDEFQKLNDSWMTLLSPYLK